MIDVYTGRNVTIIVKLLQIIIYTPDKKKWYSFKNLSKILGYTIVTDSYLLVDF